jgi:hypothetical protein
MINFIELCAIIDKILINKVNKINIIPQPIGDSLQIKIIINFIFFIFDIRVKNNF